MNSQTDGILATAATALKRNESRRPGNIERKLSSATDKYSDATSKPLAEAADAAISSGVGNLIQSQLTGWKTVSSTLVAALDELQKIHPFISVAVLPFKAALHLELKRRENDTKIIALHFMMKEMMETLFILENISVGDIENLSAYLTKTSEKFGQDITDYANAVDVYYSRKLFSRILRSQSYESDLAAYGDRFENNKQELQLRLNVRTNLKLNQVTDSLSVMMLFNLVRSPKERELMELIDKEGGASKVIHDPVLLQKVIKGNENNNRDRDALQVQEDQKLVSLVQAEIRQDLQNLVKTNETAFIRKFEAQKKSLIDALRENVDRLGDRVITAVISGPYERLINEDLSNIWKEMHWRGSAKARDLVLALRDYYHSRNQSALARQIQETASPMITTENDLPLSESRISDQWALQYINLHRIQPLIEAFDDDVSGFVTINEANALCAGRPENWSLPHWLAYWAVGFQMTLIHYYTQIRTLFQKMHTAAEQTLPANRVFIDSFLGAFPFRLLDGLLSGFQEQISYHGTWDWSDWSMFLPYVQDEEKRLKSQLEAFQYSIDASDSLLLITGPGRLERFIFPLIYLLLERQYLIVNYCRSNVILPHVLWGSLQSVDVIMDAVDVRVDDLQAIFKHKNLDEAVMMRKSVYGLFSAWRTRPPVKELHKYAPLELTFEELPKIDQTSASFISLKPTVLDSTTSDDIDIAPSDNGSEPSKDGLQGLGTDPLHVSCRARWGCAIQVVLQRIHRKAMSWSYLKERQAQRRQFIDLIIQRDCRGGWLPYVFGSGVAWDMMDTLKSLECTLCPQDVQLYRSLAWFKARRQIVHNGVTCNLCGEYVIGSRFLCLNCLLDYDDDSTDFCIQHFREYFIRKEPKCEVVHVRYHLLLQLRRYVTLRCLFSVANSSRAAFEKARARLGDPSGHPQCGNCEQSVTLPCWFCVDCDDEFFLCFECNAHDNATEPWMVDKHLCPEEGHTYVHKLILCPEAKPDEPKALSVEERLEATEKHMETMKKHMEEMEKHMEATKMNMEKHVQAMEKRMEETGKHIEASEKRIEAMEKHMEASRRSLQELLELQKENNSALQKGIGGMSN